MGNKDLANIWAGWWHPNLESRFLREAFFCDHSCSYIKILSDVEFLTLCCFDSRNMRGDDAKKACPGIELVQVPMAHGHAYLNPYRDAGSEVRSSTKMDSLFKAGASSVLVIEGSVLQ